jgi:hypothetical protein
MSVIARGAMECPTHGQHVTAFTWPGRRTCERCGRELVRVEYVRASTYQGTVDALRDARLYVESSPGLAHTGRALLDRIDAILANSGGQ